MRSIFERGPWCDRCGQKQATSWLDRLCATCSAEVELEVEAGLDALARGEITPKSIADEGCRGYGNLCAPGRCFGEGCRYREGL